MTAVALSVAGSDSGGGAGIQADLKTFAALGIYATSAITAITVQNTQGVRGVHAMAPAVVAAQIAAVREDFDVAAVKLGMLATPEIVAAVGAALNGARGVVYDPVMVASSGDALAGAGFIEAAKRLFPHLALLTPNLAEAARFLGMPEALSEAEMVAQGRALNDLGARAVLMKGGHLPGEAVDLLVTTRSVRRFAAPRIESRNLHGTGCVFSSAIAAHIAHGLDLAEAVALAKAFTRRAIENGRELALGNGPGPLMPAP
ncbi:MAG TPA: bifunctional hydroxymethylpyrimidine kinase/phosphomethylpyrimidine kinase [Roseiarcus sp.]|nr:bifunctional hydroxymethylpyrimidine kinase/phosphomethylpyrimidine kinase [Roseiarcus sp.]